MRYEARCSKAQNMEEQSFGYHLIQSPTDQHTNFEETCGFDEHYDKVCSWFIGGKNPKFSSFKI